MALCKTEDSRGKTKLEIPNADLTHSTTAVILSTSGSNSNSSETTDILGKTPFDFAQDCSSHLHSPIPHCSQLLCFSSSLLTLSLPLLFLFLLLLCVSFSSPCFEPYPTLPSGLRSLSLGGLWMSYLHKSGITLRFNGSKADPCHWVSLAKYPLSFLQPLRTISSCI